MPSGCGYFATNYKADIAILDTRFRRFWFWVMIGAIIIFPLVTPAYWVHRVNLVSIACVAALGLQLLTGYTGMISLGHAGFLCAGGFTAAILGFEAGLPFYVVIPASMLVGALLGAIAGIPALRFRGIYVILSTMAMYFIVVLFAGEYQSRGVYTSGYRIPPPSIGGWVLDSSREWYYVLAFLTFVVAIFCINLIRSRVGRAWIAIRDNDIAATVLGVNIGYYKLLAFIFSSSLASLAGCVSAYYMGYVAIDDYHFWLNITYIAIIIIGGLGSIMGVFLGSFFIILLPYALSDATGLLPFGGALQSIAFPIQFGLFGFLIILFLLVEPEGLVGIWRRIRTFFELWPFKYRRVISTR